MTLTPQIISVLVAIVSAVTLAVWVLSSKISSSRAEIVSEIGTLKTDLAVLKKSEELRDEKINKMWEWWLESLENGWRSHMRNNPL